MFKKMGFRWLLVIVLMFIISIQYTRNKRKIEGYTRTVSNLENNHQKQIERLTTNHEVEVDTLKIEVDMLKSVVNKFSGDIKKAVTVLYAAQVNTATSYSNRVCETDSTPNETASMDQVTDFTLAVSRDLFEQGWTFGKIVYIEELGEFVRIQDLMNARFCKRVDVFNTNTKEAIKFGKKKVTAYLLDDIEI